METNQFVIADPPVHRSPNRFKPFLSIILGVSAIFVPFLSIHAATFLGKTEIASFNSTLLMFLSVLIIVFMVITTFSNLNNNHKRLFVVGIILLLIDLIAFIWNLLIFVNL